MPLILSIKIPTRNFAAKRAPQNGFPPTVKKLARVAVERQIQHASREKRMEGSDPPPRADLPVHRHPSIQKAPRCQFSERPRVGEQSLPFPLTPFEGFVANGGAKHGIERLRKMQQRTA